MEVGGGPGGVTLLACQVACHPSPRPAGRLGVDETSSRAGDTWAARAPWGAASARAADGSMVGPSLAVGGVGFAAAQRVVELAVVDLSAAIWADQSESVVGTHAKL